jgi:uncharacterized membrane protein YdjX (TVP38/TMEM64 family)
MNNKEYMFFIIFFIYYIINEVIKMTKIQIIGNAIQSSLLGIGAYGIVLSFAVIFFDSIIPCAPLGLFVSTIFYSYGSLYGFLICWSATVFGCITSYHLFNKILRDKFEKKIVNKLRKKTRNKINDIISYIDNLSLSSLIILMACPFTPAFVVNIAAGLANVDKNKFYYATIIGKPFMIYFYGTIGTSLGDMINNPYVIVKLAILLLVAYGLGKICDRIVKA